MDITRQWRWTSALLPAAVLAAALLGTPRADAAGSQWARSIDTPRTPAQLGLPADASPRRLAVAALARSAAKLAPTGRLGGLRVVGQPAPLGDHGHGLRFRQTTGGLRVLWSDLAVVESRGAVSSIFGTAVPLTGELSGERRITAGRARQIALRTVRGSSASAELVAYAGEPAKPRPPRRAFVVEVAPAGSRGEDEPESICVVVDAATGKVLKQWRGSAARPADGSPARAAATKTVLIQMVDGGNQTVDLTPNYRDIWTMGNPYQFLPPFGVDTGGTVTPNATLAQQWVVDVSRFFCKVRQYCGRDSGTAGVGHGDYNRHFFTVNWKPEDDEAGSYFNDRIHIAPSAASQPQTVAHEFGHQIDDYYRDDYVSTKEGREVDEALAEMFAYDYERDRNLPGHTGTRVSDLLANPSAYTMGGISLPSHMNNYRCGSVDEHINGYILGHAYYLMVKNIRARIADGHAQAGNLAQYIPMALPAFRTFGSVRKAFILRARGLYPGDGPGGTGGEVEAAIADAFDAVGVFESTTGTGKCTPSLPPEGGDPEPPICHQKPSLPQCNGDATPTPPAIDQSTRRSVVATTSGVTMASVEPGERLPYFARKASEMRWLSSGSRVGSTRASMPSISTRPSRSARRYHAPRSPR
jgi:Zn-dependent metalloprotease